MKVTIFQNGAKKILSCTEGANLLDVLGDAVNADCGGRGTCGKCKVIIDGKEVLACKTTVTEDTEVTLPDVKNAKILTKGIRRSLQTDGEQGVGIAIDIGTTTIGAQLVRLSDGEVIKTLSQLNEQKRFGSDVLSRIEKGTQPLHQCIINQLGNMLEIIDPGKAAKRVLLAGNTAMMHLVQGFDASTLSVAPYLPYNIDMNLYPASHFGFEGDFEVIAAPCIAGFVGADTVCAILACEMDLSNKTSLLVDVGTNGEIVLKHGGGFTCCSVAAGPAFEGAHIRYGTGCVDGAISAVEIKNGIHIKTIADKPPIGMCGSGIIDAAAQMAKHEIIDETGFLEFDFKIADGIYINQKDIREIQLAKSAVRAGIDTLLHKQGIEYGQVDTLFLAGGIGSFLNLESAAGIKLIPIPLKDKAKSIGNAALSGAVSLLTSEGLRQRAQKLAAETAHISLSADVFFQDAFVENLSF